MSEQASLRPQGRLRPRLCWADALLGAVAAITAVAFWLSLDWPLQHDGPLLHYVAWSMDRFGTVPYRDIFETSMPGSFAYHWLIGRLFGWDSAGFKVVDVGLLAVLSVATIRLLQPFGWRPAVAAPMLFAITYLWLGPDMTLQRDYVGLILVVWAVLLATLGEIATERGRLAGIGLLFGLAALIKPHLTIGLGPVAWYLIWRCRHADPTMRWSDAAKAVLPTIVIVAALPGLGTLAVLGAFGALPAFFELLFDYLPLHLHLTGDHQPIEGAERISHLVMSTVHMRGLWVGIPAAVAGYFVIEAATTPDSEPRARLYLLAALAGVYLVYPSFAGQFFFYHWAPYQFFLVTLAALPFAATTTAAGLDARRYGLGFLALALVVVLIRPNLYMVEQTIGNGVPSPKGGAVDRMEAALRDHLKPGDTVQPLDWTGGAVHALLRTEARLATRFLYDYHFYHHIDRPIIATLRARFMGELERAAPRLVPGAGPLAGRVRLDGRDVTGMEPARLAAAGMALVPQRRNVIRTLSEAENLAIGAWLAPRQAQARRDEVLAEDQAFRLLERK